MVVLCSLYAFHPGLYFHYISMRGQNSSIFWKVN